MTNEDVIASVAAAYSGLGPGIRARRLEKGLSQEALARPHFTKSYVSAVERNKVRPSLKALELIARKLEVPTNELIRLAEPQFDSPEMRAMLAEAEALSEDGVAATDQVFVGALDTAPLATIADSAGYELVGLTRDVVALYARQAREALRTGDISLGSDLLVQARGAAAMRWAMLRAITRNIAVADALHNESTALLASAAVLADLVGVTSVRAQVAYLIAQQRLAQGQLDGATEFANIAGSLNPHGEWGARAEVLLGAVAEQSDRLIDADTHLEAALGIAEEVGDELVSEIAATYGELLTARGAFQRASEFYRRALVANRPGAGMLAGSRS